MLNHRNEILGLGLHLEGHLLGLGLGLVTLVLVTQSLLSLNVCQKLSCHRCTVSHAYCLCMSVDMRLV